MQLLSHKVEVVLDETPDTSYLEQDGFKGRLEAYRADKFELVGIRAFAEIEVLDTIQYIRTPGLWGIESDSNTDYLNAIKVEELDKLSDLLAELGIKHELQFHP